MSSKDSHASMPGKDEENCHWEPSFKPYMHTKWWNFLPFYIFVVMVVLSLILSFFFGVNTFVGTGAFISYAVIVILWGLLLYWLCDTGNKVLAWWLVLLPVILALAVSTIASGVAMGNSMSSSHGSKGAKRDPVE